MLKKHLAAIFICISLFSAKSFAYDKQIGNVPTSTISSVCQSESIAFITQDSFDQNKFEPCTKSDSEQIAQRGCCSHHNGVCGCSSDGRAQCCDGSLSPSCGC
jgi:hypothetical protein